MPDIAEGEVVEVQGSAAQPYRLTNLGGVYSCSCPAWLHQGGGIEARTCKHLKAYRGEAAEIARVGAAAAGGSRPRRVRVVRAGGGTEEVGEGEPAAVSQPDAAGGGWGAGGKAPGDHVPPILLAHKWENDVDLTGWWMSEKLDGVRAYWDGTQFISRQGNVFYAPDWFKEGLPDTPLDGELWVGRKEFQRTVSIVRRMDLSKEWQKVAYLVFDAPALKEPFEKRVDHIHEVLARKGAAYARAHEHEKVRDLAHVREELKRVEALGGEGLMMRQPGSLYVASRSTTLLKVKSFFDTEAKVVGHQPGAGKHKGRVGALDCVLADGTRFACGTGLSDDERENPPKIGEIITVRYQELSNAGVPRFPSYVGVRIDADWKEISGKQGGKGDIRAAGVNPTNPNPRAASPAPTKAAPNKQQKPAAAPPRAGETMAKQRFEFSDDSSNKFWEIEVSGKTHTVTYGRIGTDGQSKTKAFASPAAAQADADKLIAEKTKKGYEPAELAADGGEEEDEEELEAEAEDEAKDEEEEEEEEEEEGEEDEDEEEAEDDAPKKKSAKAAAKAAPAARKSSGPRYFEYVSGSSSKFWEVSLAGKAFTVRFGKIGTDGQTQLKSWPTAEKASAECEKLVAEKTKKGYVEK